MDKLYGVNSKSMAMNCTYSLHCVYTTDLIPEVVERHKKVCSKFNLPIIHHEKEKDEEGKFHHSRWMDDVMNEWCDKVDVVGFIDIDFLFKSKDDIEKMVHYAFEEDTIVGCAYSNNNNAKNFITISSFCYFISSSLFKTLNRPNFKTQYLRDRSKDVLQVLDTGERIINEAEKIGRRTFAYFPTNYHFCKTSTPFKDPLEPSIFRLGYYGLFGVGCNFQDKFFHLLESRLVVEKFRDKFRKDSCLDLFEQVADNLLETGIIKISQKRCNDFKIDRSIKIVDEYSREGCSEDEWGGRWTNSKMKRLLESPFSHEYHFI